jgi:hypothetical protein
MSSFLSLQVFKDLYRQVDILTSTFQIFVQMGYLRETIRTIHISIFTQFRYPFQYRLYPE